MLVCENHPDKAWPDECDCGAGMMSDIDYLRSHCYPEARVHSRAEDGQIYVIRDVWDNGTHEYSKGARLVRCEYAVLNDGVTIWKPCREGVQFADIEPLRMNATNG